MTVPSPQPEETKEVFRLVDELERRVCALAPSSTVVDLIIRLRNELTQTLVAKHDRCNKP